MRISTCLAASRMVLEESVTTFLPSIFKRTCSIVTPSLRIDGLFRAAAEAKFAADTYVGIDRVGLLLLARYGLHRADLGAGAAAGAGLGIDGQGYKSRAYSGRALVV